MRFYFPVLVLFFMMAGVYLIASQVLSIDKAGKSEHWREINAQVISMNNAKQLGANLDLVDIALTDLFLPAYFKAPHLAFAYKVGGTTYGALNYSYSIDPFGPKQWQVNEDYPIGSVITVYYDPQSPKDAVFKNGLNAHFYLVVTLGAVILVLGGYLLSKPVND